MDHKPHELPQQEISSQQGRTVGCERVPATGKTDAPCSIGEELWQSGLQATISIQVLFCCQEQTWIVGYLAYRAILSDLLAEFLSYVSITFAFHQN